MVHLPPAVVGPPDPRLVPRRRGRTSARARPRARAGSATPTCSTPGSRSALWPFATLGWPEQTPELRAFYPTDVLSTARDIIFLWVARMIMMGLEFTGEIPFYRRLHPLGHPGARRAAHVEVARHRHRPADQIEADRPPFRAGRLPAYGADACASACWRCPPPRTCASAEERSRRASSSTNKLWNASRLILLGVGPDARAAAAAAPTVEDRWILSRLAARQARGRRRGSRRFDFSHAALGLYDFVYGELCDWYLELVKPRLRRRATRRARRDAAARARARRSRSPIR